MSEAERVTVSEDMSDLRPQHDDTTPGPVQIMTQLTQASQCRSGAHTWMPWLALHAPNASPDRYVTYCVHCRIHEQYDL